MIWATDIVGLETLLYPSDETIEKFRELTTHTVLPDPASNMVWPPEIVGINWCPQDYRGAVEIEVYTGQLILAAGYKFEALEMASHGERDWEKVCWEIGNVIYENKYFGFNVHPYELVFVKTNRDANPELIQKHTEWVEGRNYSSYDYC
jgi:hypothetical protein